MLAGCGLEAAESLALLAVSLSVLAEVASEAGAELATFAAHDALDMLRERSSDNVELYREFRQASTPHSRS